METNLLVTVSQRSNDFQDIKTSTTQLHIVPNSRIAKWHIAIQPTLLIQLVLFGYSERGYFSVSVSINVLYIILYLDSLMRREPQIPLVYRTNYGATC